MTGQQQSTDRDAEFVGRVTEPEGDEQRPRVVVIDDHALLAECIVMTLVSEGIDARNVRLDAPDLVIAVLKERPDLVLLDLFLGDDTERSLAATRTLTQAGIGVLIITATSDRLLHARCVENGASAIVEKSHSIHALTDAVQRLLRSESVMSKSLRISLLTELADSRRPTRASLLLATLTPREREVLHALTLGHPAGWIARQHRTSVVTVRTHIRSFLRKLDVHCQLEAVSLATREGWFR